MQIIKRDGRTENFNFEKIIKNVNDHCKRMGLDKINVISICQKIQEGIFNNIHTWEISELVSSEAISKASIHYEYEDLASSLIVENYHKSLSMDLFHLYEQCFYDGKINDVFYTIILNHGDFLQKILKFENDYLYNYFGLKTLEKSYLIKINGQVVESPQFMLMRTTCTIHEKILIKEKITREEKEKIKNTYEALSGHYYTHGSPVYFNSGTRQKQYSSCFLIPLMGDSIEAIYKTIATCAKISQGSGGIGINISNVRCKGSKINKTNGISNGIIPMLRVFNESSRYIDQGGGKRKGSYCFYLEPWHGDVFEFLEIKKNHGLESMRCRDLFQGLWISDLFMKRVEADEDWSLFCPNDVNLFGKYGEDFESAYLQYEYGGFAIKVIKARLLWNAILTSQIETGGPFMLYKDKINKCSNQKHLGTIVSSNLCTEIVQFHDNYSFGVCNLASIALPKFVIKNDVGSLTFDFDALEKMVGKVVENVNLITMQNQFPFEECNYDFKTSAPIGIGVQGLADVFQMMGLAYESIKAKELNCYIFECIYYGALKKSLEMGKEWVYEGFGDSDFGRGLLQFDYWDSARFSGRYDWGKLREEIKKNGTFNSLLTTIMPTATTAQILGNSESVEPVTNNLYVRRVLAGEFEVINMNLMIELETLGLWDQDMRLQIIKNRGSIQNIPNIPKSVKNVYKTVWEISQKSVIDMAVGRSPFIDQSQSLNIHLEDVTFAKLTSMHFYGWKSGLKTGMYYLRTKAASNPIQFTVEAECTSCMA